MRNNRSRRDFLVSVSAVAAGCAASGEPLPAAEVAQAPPHIARAGDRYVHERRVLLWECTRKEIREALESGSLKAAIIPTGSTEQHNEHLAMIQDTASAVTVSQNAALLLYPEVIVATPVPVGISPYWMERRGTLTLREETLLAVVYEICESLKTHGLKTILIVNGHGGNAAPLKAHVPEWRRKLGIRLDACSYWESYTRENAARYMQSGMSMIPGHSAEFETSFALAAFPERVHREGVDYSKVRLNLKSAKDAEEDRTYYRDSLLATPEKGEALIRIAVDWVADKMRQMIAEANPGT
jgi:creatinine amidohydrolase